MFTTDINSEEEKLSRSSVVMAAYASIDCSDITVSFGMRPCCSSDFVRSSGHQFHAHSVGGQWFKLPSSTFISGTRHQFNRHGRLQ